ncbi:unnamed protein product [Urochloa decumbens]|uniref:O-methyltransferase ZRP4 n=1 Tax=Urochloa decumbens TaxID=240449 RepID=A0ABC8Z265_9POAL
MSPAQEELDTQSLLLQGYVELQQHALSHLKSMALACATGLGIPSAIYRRGGAATISDLIAQTGLPESKLPYLRRLMRVLTVSGIVGTGQQPSGGESSETTVYTLTPVCRVLVHGGGGGSPSSSPSCDMSALLRLLTRPSTTLAPFFNLEAWFRDDAGGSKTAFEMVHGMSPWSLTKKDASFNKTLNDACVADSSMTMDAMLRQTTGGGGGGNNNDIFQGITSLVDVGGGHGAAAIAIARAFPHIKCSVLDLEQVVSEAPDDATVQFIAGDMFKSIPPADAVLLKGVLNCWDDDNCIKILKVCKEAIPARDAGGKVIIVNMVVGYGTPDTAVREAQVLVDLYLMRAGGIERDEREWKKVFFAAGFSGYKIMPILGTMSVIQVFP